MKTLAKLQQSYDLCEELKNRIILLKNNSKMLSLKNDIYLIRENEKLNQEKLKKYRTDLKRQEKDIVEIDSELMRISGTLYDGNLKDLCYINQLLERQLELKEKKSVILKSCKEIMYDIEFCTNNLNKIKFKIYMCNEDLEKIESVVDEKIREYENKLMFYEKTIIKLKSKLNKNVIFQSDTLKNSKIES